MYEIDVKGEKDWPVADPLADFGQHIVDATYQQFLGRDQMKGECPRATAVVRSVQGTADAELDLTFRIDQAFLDGALAPGAMRVPLAPVAVPGIGVRVEVDQADRAVAPSDQIGRA